MMSLGVMSLALLPSLFVYNGGFIGGIRALRKGKAAFMEVHTNTLPELRRIYGRPLLWNACMVSLVFARRIYRNGGVLPALYLTWKAFREEGRQGLLVETENIVPVEGRNSKLADVLACIQDTRTVASAVSATVVVPVYNGLNHLENYVRHCLPIRWRVRAIFLWMMPAPIHRCTPFAGACGFTP